MLVCCTVVFPVALAIGTVGDERAWPWVPYVVPPLMVAVAIVGAIYSVKRWIDPPLWAVLLARGEGYRERWHRSRPP